MHNRKGQGANAAISASLVDTWLARAEVPGQSNPSLPATGIGGEALGVTLGVDFPIGFGRVVLVPTFRLHRVFRDVDTRDQIGLGRWAIRPGIGIRAAF